MAASTMISLSIIASSLVLIQSQSTSFSGLSFEHTTNEDFNGVNMDIGWIEFASCKEGCSWAADFDCDTDDHLLQFPNGWTKQQMIDIARYAITVKILPSTDIPDSTETTEYAVKADICSNPIYALNNGYELSFTMDLSTSIVTGFADLNNWIGSNNAKSRLVNSCYPSGLSGTTPRLIIDDELLYQACGNTDGMHILYEGVADINCLWEYNLIVGHDPKIWIGFDQNKAKICEVISSDEYALIATADPTDAPSTSTAEPSSFPSHEPSRMPSEVPTFNPSQIPSYVASFSPNIIATAEPSDRPADNPSILIVANMEPKDTHVTNPMNEAITDIVSTHNGDEFEEPMKPNNDELYLILSIISAVIVICCVSVAVLLAYMQFGNKKESKISQINMVNNVKQKPQIQKVAQIVNPKQEMNGYANDSDDNDELWEHHHPQKDTQTAGTTTGTKCTGSRGETKKTNSKDTKNTDTQTKDTGENIMILNCAQCGALHDRETMKESDGLFYCVHCVQNTNKNVEVLNIAEGKISCVDCGKYEANLVQYDGCYYCSVCMAFYYDENPAVDGMYEEYDKDPHTDGINATTSAKGHDS